MDRVVPDLSRPEGGDPQADGSGRGLGVSRAWERGQAGGSLRITLTEAVWQQESLKVATGKSRSNHQETSEAGCQDTSLSGPGSTGKLRQRHPSGSWAKNTVQWPVSTQQE